ncbi:MAG: hypothetical protein ACKOAH_12505, partial [Pirellula sp.]
AQVEPERIIESLFVRALSRKPTAEERVDLMAFVSGNEKSQDVYEDIFWALMNSTEFLFNH